MLLCPAESTNRSRPAQSGSAGLCRIVFWNNVYARGARLIAVPGWPLPTFCTASMASTRAVSTARLSKSVQSSSVTGRIPSDDDVRKQRRTATSSWDSATSAARQTWSSDRSDSVLRLLTPGEQPHTVPTPPRGGPHPPSPLDFVGEPARPLLEPPSSSEVLLTVVDPRASAPPRIDGPSTARDVVAAYVGLMKPRIIELLLLTTVPVMFLAEGAVPPLGLVIATVLGGTLSAGSANALNCVYDADIDERMRRTRRRALPRPLVSRRNALVFGLALGVVSTLWLGLLVNWLSAGLALAANVFYVVGYTMILKRRTTQNIVWGGAAGCFPALIGWTAVTGSLAWAPLVLFLVVFFWTPPHFWALAIRYREDYAAAGVPMLPVKAGARTVARKIVGYSYLTVVTSLLLWPVAGTGWFYPAAAAVLGGAFLVESHLLLQRSAESDDVAALKPMRLFHWSNMYLSLLFVAVPLDPLLTR